MTAKLGLMYGRGRRKPNDARRSNDTDVFVCLLGAP